MDSPGSVTFLVAQLKAGNEAAAAPIMKTYLKPLLARLRRKLRGALRPWADEEDVAQSAFASFFRAATQGRFARLNDRRDLWQLLVVLSNRKACNLLRYDLTQRPRGGMVLDEAALPPGDSGAGSPALGGVAGREPNPASAVQAGEKCRRMLDVLGDAQLKRVATLRMKEYTVEEIAVREGRVPRTVKRWLRLIRQIWEREGFQPGARGHRWQP